MINGSSPGVPGSFKAFPALKIQRVSNGFNIFARDTQAVFSDTQPVLVAEFVSRWVNEQIGSGDSAPSPTDVPVVRAKAESGKVPK